jgi:hypothetical protein
VVSALLECRKTAAWAERVKFELSRSGALGVAAGVTQCVGGSHGRGGSEAGAEGMDRAEFSYFRTSFRVMRTNRVKPAPGRPLNNAAADSGARSPGRPLRTVLPTRPTRPARSGRTVPRRACSPPSRAFQGGASSFARDQLADRDTAGCTFTRALVTGQWSTSRSVAEQGGW